MSGYQNYVIFGKKEKEKKARKKKMYNKLSTVILLSKQKFRLNEIF
jgi:hypothetical protein